MNKLAVKSLDSLDQIIEGELIGQKVMIWDYDQGSKLYAAGFFGKPLGIRKPKTQQFDRPSQLSLIEATYLVKQGKLVVTKDNKKKPLSYKELFQIGEKYYEHFEEKLVVFEDIRKRGLIPRPGLKFGADFAVYQKGPGIDHSPYVITALPRGSDLTAIGLVQAGRLATSVRKKFVIATILKNNEIRYYGFVWRRP
jgi:tRNA-intron endonuclease